VGRLFGTDGVRGVANADLTPELALRLATAAAIELTGGERSGGRPVAVVGRDPRASGELLEAAVTAGLASAGMDVRRLGVLPTPAVAYLTIALGADVGVVISASHNPMPDNGIKFFDNAGYKLADPVEDAVEARLAASGPAPGRPTGAGVGRISDEPAAVDRYVGHLMDTLPCRLDGLTVVVDCANGAASLVAPAALRAAGATVHAIAAEPDGYNINEGCGSTHPEPLADAVRGIGADVGIAHDGDADRCIAVDAEGREVDGDAILAICAVDRHQRGVLAGNAVATTVMTNLGFHRAMRDAGIEVVQTPVGDRYVLAALQEHRLVLGGEQSGHLVFLEYATTGDGILTALQLLGRMAGTGQPLAKLAAVMTRMPQALVNRRVADREAAMGSERLADAVREAEAALGGDGRVLVRPSGTEPVVRVMVEAPTAQTAQDWAARIAATLR
jgi:phosphoglucosamine mutase